LAASTPTLPGPLPTAQAPTAPTVAAGAALGATAHQQRLQTWHTLAGSCGGRHQRGSAWQQPQLALEQAVRDQAVAFRHWAATQGLNHIESAACLGLSLRTLRQWEHATAQLSLALLARGRPVLRSPRPARMEVLEVLESIGPGVGLAVLQGQFPDLPRAELADLLRRYRRVWQRRHTQAPHVLHWTQPGTVWAMDYAEPPLPLEEGFRHLLAVRDLASGQQLLWLPVASATAATTVAALLLLFTVYGPPLVLKMDNGSPFVAAATQTLLAQWQVLPLYSPPRLPQYNGAVEAGIGALKARTHYQASRRGHPDLWTLADTAAAQEQANSLGRPGGAHAPTPAQHWAQRHVVTLAERAAFQQTVACLQEEEARTASAAATAAPPPAQAVATAAPPQGAATPPAALTPAQGSCPACADSAAPALGSALPTRRDEPSAPTGSDTEAVRPDPERSAERRQAISRALVAHGYLLFTRRRIPLPLPHPKVAKIT
jgi:transposase InsO family protein